MRTGPKEEIVVQRRVNKPRKSAESVQFRVTPGVAAARATPGCFRRSFLGQALDRVGQCFESSELDFGTVMELRQNIETNVLVWVGHHSRHGGDPLFSKRIHDLGDV